MAKVTPEQIAAPDTERAHQKALFASIAGMPEYRWVHAIPNGGQRAPAVAMSMKAEGQKAGVWDIFAPYPRGRYAGLYIEMKKPGREREKDGGLSPDQVQFRLDLPMYAFAVCYSWKHARFILDGYMQDGFID